MGGAEVRGGVVVSVVGKTAGDLIMDRKEALDLPRRLEPLHDPLSSPGRLGGVFSPVVEALVLPMLDPGHALPLGGDVAFQLIGDEHAQCSTLFLQEVAEQAFGGRLVAPALEQDIEDEALLVDGMPEPVFRPGDGENDLVEVPLVATARCAPTDPAGEFLPEFEAPLPDRLVRTEMPQAASISATLRRLKGNRKYSHSA